MRRIGLAAMLALAACGGQTLRERTIGRFTEPAPLPAVPDDACLSAQYRKYLGQSSEVLGGLVFGQPMRIVLQDEALDRSYSPVRVNFEIDAAGNISRIWCG